MKRTYEAWAALVTSGGYDKSSNKHKAGRLGLVHCTDISFKNRLKGMRLMEATWGRAKSAPEYCAMTPPRPGYSAFETWYINLLMAYYKTEGIAICAANRMPLSDREKEHARMYARKFFNEKRNDAQQALPFDNRPGPPLPAPKVEEPTPAPFSVLKQALNMHVRLLDVFLAIDGMLTPQDTERVMNSLMKGAAHA